MEFLADKDESDETQIFCPYCGEEIKVVDSHTEETRRLVHNLAYREVIYPGLKEIFDTMSGFNQSTGLIRIEFSKTNFSKPPLLISGPALPDMKVVRTMCCDLEMKIYNHWEDLVYCSSCGRHSVLF